MSFRFLTAGESHGPALTGIIEGLPSGIDICPDELKKQMKRRMQGYGRGHRMKIEDDAVEVLSGIRHGKTLGSPISLLIQNKDWKVWQDIMGAFSPPNPEKPQRLVHIPRPGHADFVGGRKYNHSDLRNVLERASARETAMRVGLGNLCRQFLEKLDVHIASRVTRIGSISDESPMDISIKDLNSKTDLSATRSLFLEKEMKTEIDQAKETGDSLGGHFEVYASGLPMGLGSYSQWDRRLEGKIGQYFLSLNAVKGVELGLGFKHGEIRGSEAHDEYFQTDSPSQIRFQTNRAGGITGGMTTGQDLIVRVAMKPISTLMKPLNSVDLNNGEPTQAHVERSDTCAVPAAAVIGESLLCLLLSEAILEKFGGDSMNEILPRFEKWKNENR